MLDFNKRHKTKYQISLHHTLLAFLSNQMGSNLKDSI
jgi:hypothetical protein